MDTKIIGARITRARKEKNMSQAQLAQHIFISPQAVGKWERGESMPDITTFTRLAELLEVDFNYFSDLPSTDDEPSVKFAGPGEKQAAGGELPSARAVRMDLNAVDLQGSDFAGVALHNGKFKAGTLRGADFTHSDLTGCSFEAIDAREATFEGANLTGCTFSVTDLAGTSFQNATLVRTRFSMSGQGAEFVQAKLVDTLFSKTDLTRGIFRECVFQGVDFSYCDLRGMGFDGQTFIGVRFDKSALNDASFQGATLRNVSFTPPFSLTNKAYQAMKTIRFDGAIMDKLTYAALKNLRVIDLEGVTLLQ